MNSSTNAFFPVGVSTPKLQFIPQLVQEPEKWFLWMNSHQIYLGISGRINSSLVWISHWEEQLMALLIRCAKEGRPPEALFIVKKVPLNNVNCN